MFHRKSPKNLPSSSECKYFKQVFILGSYRKTFEERAWIWDERVLEPYDIISWMLFWENCRNIGDYEERRQQNSWILLMINLRLGKKPELHLLVEVFWIFMIFRQERHGEKSTFYEIKKNFFPRGLENERLSRLLMKSLNVKEKWIIEYMTYEMIKFSRSWQNIDVNSLRRSLNPLEREFKVAIFSNWLENESIEKRLKETEFMEI